MDLIEWAAWGGGVLLFILFSIFFGWGLYEKYRDRYEPDVNMSGATEAWADPDTGELAKIVKEVSYDRDSEPTSEIDMDELHTRLALEDVQIAFDRGSKAIVDSVINTLTDDKAWAAAIAARKARKN